jgi:MATE family multidrug resistance protein
MLWCWLFIIRLGYLEYGAGLASSLTYFTNFFLSLCLLRIFSLGQKTWTLCSFRSLCPDLGKYLKYAIPSAIMLIFDVFTYELSIIVACFLGQAELSAHIALLATNCLVWMISFGIAECSCSLIGNYLGQKKPKTARKMAAAGIILLFIIIIPLSVTYWLFRREIA